MIIGVISVSFAFLSVTKKQETANNFTSGCLGIEIVDESKEIQLNKAYPISDVDGLNQDGYTFTIKNSCNTATNYQINLENINQVSNTISSEYIKVSLFNTDISNLISKLTNNDSVTPVLENAYEAFNLYSGSLDGNESKTFTLKQWIDYDTTIEQGANKTYSSKVTITANPEVEIDSIPNIKFDMNIATLTDATNMNYCVTSTNACTPNVNIVANKDSQTKEITATIPITSTNNSLIICGNLNNNKTTVCSAPFIYDNYLIAGRIINSDTENFLGSNVSRSTFESITTLDNIDIPNDAIYNWDVSEAQNQSIMAWYLDTDNNGKYELYIGQDGGVKANPYSGYLLSYFTNVTNMDLSHLNTSNVINAKFMFANNSSITNLDLSSFDTSNMINIMDMFWKASSLETVDLSSFNTSKVVNMWGVFNEATSLKSLDLSSFDTSNTEIMTLMFQKCQGLTSLDLSNFDTSNVTSMREMFIGANNLTSLDLSNFDTSNVTNMSSMFSGAKKLEILNVSSFDTSKVTDMTAMFSGLSNLTSLDVTHFDTSNVTSMKSMFNEIGVATLDLSNFDTSKVTNMFRMFSLTKLTDLDLSSFNTSNVTDMHSMFWSSGRLKSINLSSFDTSNVTDMYGMFLGTKVTDLDLSTFNTSNVTTMEGMFNNTTTLQKLIFNKATFNSVEVYNNMFNNSNVIEIIAKDDEAKSFIQSRLNDANITTATIKIE